MLNETPQTYHTAAFGMSHRDRRCAGIRWPPPSPRHRRKWEQVSDRVTCCAHFLISCLGSAFPLQVLPHTGILSTSFSVTSSRGSAQQRPPSALLLPATRPTPAAAVPPALGPHHTVRALIPDGIPHSTSLQGSRSLVITVEAEGSHGPHAGQVLASAAVNPHAGHAHPFGLPSQHPLATLGEGGIDVGQYGEDANGEDFDPNSLRLHSQATGYPGALTPTDAEVSPFISPLPRSLHAISEPLYRMEAPYATTPLPGMPPDSSAAPGLLVDISGGQGESGRGWGSALAREHGLGFSWCNSRHVSLQHSLTSPVSLVRDPSHGSPVTSSPHHLHRHHRSISSNNNGSSKSISRARLLTALSHGSSIGAGFSGPVRSSSSGGGGVSPGGTAMAGGERGPSPSRSSDTRRLRSRSRVLEGETVAARAAAVSQLVRGLSRGRGQ